MYEVFERGPDYPGYVLVTKYEGRGGYNWGDIESQKSVPLSPYDIEDIKVYLKRTLDFPKMDYSISTDGSVWALESMLYQYTAVAFANPQYNTKRRGLEDFVFMKEYLEKLAK